MGISGVLLDQQTLGDDISLTPLMTLFSQWKSYTHTEPQEIVEHSKDRQVIITNKVVIDELVMVQLPQLKLIAVAATGTNNIDLEAAQRLGIRVVNVEGYAGAAVAQHCFNLLLQLAGRSQEYHQFMQQGGWPQSQQFCHLGYTMTELAGKTLGIVGFGNLGKAVAKVAKAFDMHVLISDHPGVEFIREGRVSFEQLLSHSDVVSLHCPQTAHNELMINRETLALMKPSAFLINTARGGLVNEQDLVDALTEQVIAGAALDVLSTEPPTIDNPLLNYQGGNLVITPHIAWATKAARIRLVEILSDNIAQELSTLKPSQTKD
ncbi:glycerate dehydrogenase [Alteromonadales bacterium alter-6D02]|nr:glycerate dehydrogenase [Alteromonadales bacterium alter-6D02]